MISLLSLLTLSLNRILLVWVFIEITTLAFLFLITSDYCSVNSIGLKYFITQSLASIIVVIIIVGGFNIINDLIKNMLIIVVLSWKVGIAPFHYWFLNVIIDTSWFIFIVISTLIKVAPFYIITIFPSNLIYFISIIRVAIPALSGVSQHCLKKILGVSSIFTSGWVVLAISSNNGVWVIIFVMYSIILMVFCKILNNLTDTGLDMGLLSCTGPIVYLIFLTLLRLSGIPPFRGFFIKLYVLSILLQERLLIVSFLIVISSSLTIYIYLKFIFKYMSIITLESFLVSKNTILLPATAMLGLLRGVILIIIYM